MNTFVSCIAILIASLAVPSSAHPHGQPKTGGNNPGKFYLPSEWLRISIKNDTLIKVPVGASVQIDCEALGSPPPTLKWHHNDTLLSTMGFPEQNEIGNNVAIGKLRSRIFIGCVKPEDQGLYTCSGISGSRKRNPPVITLIVEENDETRGIVCNHNKPMAPHILTWAPTLLEFLDRDAVLPCRAVGTPAPEVFWMDNNGEVIDPLTHPRGYKVLETGELLISRLVWDDMGTYACRTVNSYGEDQIETFLYPVKRAEDA